MCFLVSWIAVNNDPFERERSGDSYRHVAGKPVPGPTLTLLFDPHSPYAGSISDVVLFHGRQKGADDSRQARPIPAATTADSSHRVATLAFQP